MPRLRWLVAACLACSVAGAPTSADSISLSELDLKLIEQGWGKPLKNRAVEDHPLKIAGTEYTDGVGTHAESLWAIDLAGDGIRFQGKFGVDDHGTSPESSIRGWVVGDGKVLWKSPVLRAGEPAVEVDVELRGVKTLELIVTNAGDSNRYDHANWVDARIEYTKTKPRSARSPKEEKVILSPKPSAKPRINSAKVFGVRPGSPILYTLAASGERPMKLEAVGLPEGTTFDPAIGQINGAISKHGEYPITLRASNAQGSAEAVLKLVVGERIALTPPMGWNSWNCFAHAVSAEKVKSAADAMVSSGLINHGWQYINVDDFWQQMPSQMDQDKSLGGPGRDSQGKIVPNPRFPDMKSLADFVHAKGLKFGIYSSPGPLTCGGCLGSFDHEALDAATYAEWGVDYLKYDWCSYIPEFEARRGQPISLKGVKFFSGSEPKDRELLIKPYRAMGEYLKAQKRDIVYSLCQYGTGNVSEWGGSVGGQLWRTTHDIVDTWESVARIGFNQHGLEQFAKPGNWNDPDMLVLGKVGWGARLHDTRLTPNEQYSHFSLWCLLSAPLLIGCDMTQLDAFTLSLLTNDEVIAINQDPLGQQAKRVHTSEFGQVWMKNLEDGGVAIGLFNLSPVPADMLVDLERMGLKGKFTARDLWRQKEIGEIEGSYSAIVPRHGVLLMKWMPIR